jgi:hypothetical protein
MRKQLAGLHWERDWMSQMGCLKGCLDYLGVDLSLPRLYGLTATAFVVNMHAEACPSGPTAWLSAEVVAALLPNLGAQAEFVLGSKQQGNLAEAQANAWEMARRHLDAGLPVYGWELEIPEYYVIHGHDHAGYYYSGPMCEDGAGPKPWQQLGDTDIGVLILAGLKPCAPSSLPAAVADALDVALRFAEPDNPWRLGPYTTGPAAFEVWAEGLENGVASEFGHRYCAAVWSECRHNAVRFLIELTEQLSGDAAAAAEEALVPYRRVANLLGSVSAEHVFVPDVPEGQLLRDAESAHMLRQAAAAEAEGLQALRRLTEALPA